MFDLAGPLLDRRTLDVGAGDGTYAFEASMRGARTVGIDPEEAMVAATQRRLSARGVCARIARAKVEALPFRDAAFDLVLAVTVLCFVRDSSAALREIGRVLAPGGRLVIGELGRWSVWAAERRVRGWLGHPTWREVRFWSRRDLCHLVESAGLAVDVVHGAIHYPPCALAARTFSRIDRALGRLQAPGAAFLAVAAHKPEEPR